MRELKFIHIVIVAICLQPAKAQFAESFADGEYRSSPAWQGDDTRFVISGGRLRLQAPPQAGVASLVTASKAVHDASWVFSVQMDFTPSSTNYAKVFLMADQPVLGGPVNGYFVKIGGTTREVSLYRQTGLVESELIDGLDDRVNQGIVHLGVKVMRNHSGNWELSVDVGKTGTYAKEGETQDVVYVTSRWFGIQCVYTSTRSDKFWFDDFLVEGGPVPDTTPPTLVQLTVKDQHRIFLQFSEAIRPLSLDAKFLLDGIGHPASVYVSPDSLSVELLFQAALVNARAYQLHVNGIEDRAGNPLFVDQSVMYFKPGVPGSKSVIFTEILADPSPQMGLPAAEYVEVYNRSDEPFDLTGWTIKDERTHGVMSNAILRPGEYIILTSASAVSFFNPGPAVGVSNFPSLNNSGDRIWLMDTDGRVIDSVSYSAEWIGDEDKKEGGWALELIDLANPCGEERNWTASEADAGGTPGRTNSVSASKPDVLPPNLLEVYHLDSTHLVITFDELLHHVPETDVRIEPLTAIADIRLYGQDRRSLRIELLQSLRPRVTYSIYLTGVRDCMGNRMDGATLEFGIAEPADSGDVVVSEILFNPRPGGVDFVELFNRSSKFIQLEGWRMGNESSQTAMPRFLLHPQQYVAVSENPEVVAIQYASASRQRMIRGETPSLPDDEGEVSLINPLGGVMDKVSYRASWHSVFLKDNEGVSLERLQYTEVAQLPGNWISASARAGYATPGRPNSQQASLENMVDRIEIAPQILSRDNAADAYVLIRYHFESAGTVANISIMNHQGVMVKRIAENEWLGNEGFFRWEGDRSDGGRVPSGYYFVWFEWFDAMGNQETYRGRVIVTSR